MDAKGIADAIGLVQKVVELGKRASQVQQQDALLAAREALQAQREQNLQLREKLLELKSKLTKKNDFVLENAVYYQKSDSALKQPFCPACMAKGLETPMKPDTPNTDQTEFQCPVCKHRANPNNYMYKESAVVDPLPRGVFRLDDRF